MRDLALEFAAQGHEPVVLVPDENIRGLWEVEIRDGIQVLRLSALRSKDVGHVRRAIAEAMLPWLMRRGLRRSPYNEVHFDAVVWLAPSIFFGPLVSTIRHASGCRSYLILRDIFPEWAVDLGLLRRGLAYRFFKRIERQQYLAADVIGVQAPSDQKYFQQLAHSPRRHVEVLWNWLSDSPNIGSKLRVEATALAGRTIFVYAGNMGLAQNVDSLIDLAESLRAHRDIGFLFVGRGSEYPRLLSMARSRQLDNVLFHEEIPSEEVPGLLAQCHVGLLALDPRHRFNNIPGKFLAYMRAGLPVLASINLNNDLAAVIASRGVGFVSDDVPGQSLIRHAEALACDPAARAQMAARGRSLAEELFSPASAVNQIVSSLSRSGPAESRTEP